MTLRRKLRKQVLGGRGVQFLRYSARLQDLILRLLHFQIFFTEFYVRVTVHLNTFFIIKSTRCTNFTIFFWHETLYVSDSSSVHQQEFIHCTLSNGICRTVCRVSCQNKFVKLVHLVGFIIKKVKKFFIDLVLSRLTLDTGIQRCVSLGKQSHRNFLWMEYNKQDAESKTRSSLWNSFFLSIGVCNDLVFAIKMTQRHVMCQDECGRKTFQNMEKGSRSTLSINFDACKGPGLAQWLRRRATSRTVPGSIPGGVTGFFSDILLPTVPWPWGRHSPW